jgi:hypothetical protein
MRATLAANPSVHGRHPAGEKPSAYWRSQSIHAGVSQQERSHPQHPAERYQQRPAPPGFSPAAAAQLAGNIAGSTFQALQHCRLIADGSVSARWQLAPMVIEQKLSRNHGGVNSQVIAKASRSST